MLPRDRRLRRPAEFQAVFSSRIRAATPSVVVHVARPTGETTPETPRVGFVVSKQVGNAVQRNRVKRRLRHMVRDQAWMPVDAVVRALPAAATTPERLAGDLASAWRRAGAKVSPC